ncbi:MAG: DUF308 domain-containing protein [Tannerellaceae bacterium]
MKNWIDKVNYSVRFWWMSILLGIFYIIVAISLLFTPIASYIALSVVFSLAMFISGILEIAFAISNRKTIATWAWYMVGGLIDLVLGVFLIRDPELSMGILPLIVAFWLMFRGFTTIGYAMDLRRYGTRNWGWYVLIGILAIICSISIIWQPELGVLTVVYMISYALLILGVFKIILGFELRTLHTKNKSKNVE